MKYCPTCQTQFEGQEAFCPHDGTRLVDQSTHQPGHLTGSSLAGIVNLEGYLFSDHLGERYRARLLSDNSLVRVTVFHRRFDTGRIESAQEDWRRLGSPLPSHLLSVHSVHADDSPGFVVEEWPEAYPLSRLLKKKKRLTWRQALFLTIKIARVLNWMADAGVPHRSLHPRSLFIDDPEEGELILGEWLHGLFTFPLPELTEDTPGAAIPVYPGYLAPEWIEGGDIDLHCAAVYSAGAVLYTALGQPLCDADDPEELHRWLAKEASQAPQLELPDGAPDSIAALAEVMIAPCPEKRFDSPLAAIAALASILEVSADQIAPAVKPRKDSPFDDSTTPDDSKSQTARQEDISDARKTHIGLPAQAMDEDDDDPPAKAAPRVIVDGDSTSIDDDAIPRQARDNSSTDDADEDVPRSKQTLMMGTASPVGVEDDATSEDEAQADDDSNVSGSTVVNFRLDDSDGEGDAEDSEQTSDARDSNDEEAESSDESEEAEDDVAGNTVLNFSLKDDDSKSSDDEDENAEASSDEEEEDGESSDEGNEERSDSENDGDPEENTASIIVDSELQSDPSEPLDDDAESDEPEESSDSDGLSIGFVEAQQAEDDGVSDVFFARSNQDAWEQEVVRASYEQSERMEKVTRWGMIIGGLIILAGAVLYFQAIYEPTEEEDDESSGYAWDNNGVDEAEWDYEIERFHDAVERGDIIRPDGGSAEDILEGLRRHPNSDIYPEYRQLFVEAADEQSRKQEEAGELRMAFALARTADDYARGDEELRERSERLHDEYQELRQRERQALQDQADQSSTDEGEDSYDPDDPFAELLEEAFSALSDHDYDDAIEKFGAVLDEDSEHPVATRGMANTYFRQGDYEQALEYQKILVELLPDEIKDRLQLGTIYFESEHYEEAIEQWKKILEDEPDNRDAQRYINLAERHL